ncbi:MAG: UMP kinase [Candidatus Altiarchaeota archaeon]
MKIVFSVGGSIVAPDNVDNAFVKQLASFLAGLSESNQVAVVVGGGAPARREIKKAKDKGLSEAECDYIGILATRENAKALAAALGENANRKIPETIADAAKLFGKKILVMGGTEPGHSTDAVAALIADWAKADLLINATNVDGIYDKDPKKNKDARLLKSVKIDSLLQMIVSESVGAGKYALMDLTSVKIVQRSKIRTAVLNGRDLGNVSALVSGKDFRGTTVLF